MKARDNPFRTDRVLCVRYRLRDTTWPELLSRLASLNHRAAIVGPEGAGKTTLLEDLEPHLATRGFQVKHLRLDDLQPSFDRAFLARFCEGLSQCDVILFDGAEQLGLFAWQMFKRRTRAAGGLIITSHCAGLLPTLINCRTDAQLFAELVQDLRGETSLACDLDALFARHRGNIRHALRELYDHCAEGRGILV